MFEKWAETLAVKIKQFNPEETAPVDVLIFGLTIMLNLLFTISLIMIVGLVLGVPWLMAQITISFTLLRILTGGAHLDRSLACSLTSMSFIILIALLPNTKVLVSLYFLLSFLLLLRYAPYYEEHQLVHSKQWEQKKKVIASLWVFTAMVLFHLFDQHGFILGALLQTFLLTPVGINLTHNLNTITSKGGVQREENS